VPQPGRSKSEIARIAGLTPVSVFSQPNRAGLHGVGREPGALATGCFAASGLARVLVVYCLLPSAYCFSCDHRLAETVQRTRRNPDYQIRNRRIAGLTPVSSFRKLRIAESQA